MSSLCSPGLPPRCIKACNKDVYTSPSRPSVQAEVDILMERCASLMLMEQVSLLLLEAVVPNDPNIASFYVPTQMDALQT